MSHNENRHRNMQIFAMRDYMTLAEIGEKFGITRERVRQIVKRYGEKMGEMPLMDVIYQRHSKLAEQYSELYRKWSLHKSVAQRRGINWYDDWELFEEFVNWALKNGWKPGLVFYRLSKDGYSPTNCKFGDTSEASKAIGSRRARSFVIFGEKKSINEWAEDSRCVVSLNTLRKRIEWSWDLELALTLPADKSRKFVMERRAAGEVFD